MDAVKVAKVFSNNAISAITHDGRDAVALGKGIGFGARPGDTVDARRIEKLYFVQTEMQAKFYEMLQDVRPEVMDAAEEIIRCASEAGLTTSAQATISLIDHIDFAIERTSSGKTLPNLMLHETQLLYPKEYALGLQSLRIIQRHCGVALPEDEAGYIALHLVSISVDRSAAYDTLKFVKGTKDIIRRVYDISWDEQDLDAMRLTTHLKFLALRILKHERWEDSGMEETYRQLLATDARNETCLAQINEYLQKNFHYTLNLQEKLYLLIHLTKIVKG